MRTFIKDLILVPEKIFDMIRNQIKTSMTYLNNFKGIEVTFLEKIKI
jgi:hypothetical protein